MFKQHATLACSQLSHSLSNCLVLQNKAASSLAHHRRPCPAAAAAAVRRGCVSPEVLGWVQRTADALPTVPSLAFIHIPVPQFMQLWNQHHTNGSKGEPVGCPLFDTRAFDTLRQGCTAQQPFAGSWQRAATSQPQSFSIAAAACP